MSPDSEGLGAAVEAGVGSTVTQPSGISYVCLYTFFSEVLASVMILGRNSLLKKGKSRECHNQTAALPRHQEEEETDKSKQAHIEQTYEKH